MNFMNFPLMPSIGGFWTSPAGNNIWVGESLDLSELLAALVSDHLIATYS